MLDPAIPVRIPRIAMWSGPRNISTAMMRSFGNRRGAHVSDEPFYAHYLKVTGIDHPGAGEILERYETDPDVVIEGLVGEVLPGTSLFYQKHMAQHMIEDVDRGWFDRVTHAFLIRDPLEVLISFTKKFPTVEVKDTGLRQQFEIFESVREATGRMPPVVDSRDVLTAPREVLSALCRSMAIEFDEAMLDWPPGPRDTDGVWAKHWYTEVETTRSFNPPRPRPTEIPAGLESIHAECREIYEQLYVHRLRPSV